MGSVVVSWLAGAVIARCASGISSLRLWGLGIEVVSPLPATVDQESPETPTQLRLLGTLVPLGRYLRRYAKFSEGTREVSWT